jgi:hypothetical protein
MDINETATLPETAKNDFQKLLNVDLKKLDNPLLAKLVEEVRIEESIIDTNYYNRFHNRHNRS